MNIYGTWHGPFHSRSGMIHHFTLTLEMKDGESVASLCLKRGDATDPRHPRTEIAFSVQAKISENADGQFVALLAQDDSGMLFTTTLKAESNGDVLRGPLVFNSVRTHEIDQEEVEWKREPGSELWPTWYSTFHAGPAGGNALWFTLHLNPRRTAATLEAKGNRKDVELNPSIRVHIETSGPYTSLMVKDYNTPHGMVSMILHPDGPNCMRGQMIWNSLTDGMAGVIRVKESKEILWTTEPSEDHPAARPH